MMTKARHAAVEEAKGSITEAIGKVTGDPKTEFAGAAMKKVAQRRKVFEDRPAAPEEEKKS